MLVAKLVQPAGLSVGGLGTMMMPRAKAKRGLVAWCRVEVLGI